MRRHTLIFTLGFQLHLYLLTSCAYHLVVTTFLLAQEQARFSSEFLPPLLSLLLGLRF